MSGQIRYSDDFKIDAIAQFSKPQRQTDQEAGVRRLKKELARVSEERDILKKATAYFAQDAKCGPLLNRPGFTGE